MDRSKIIPYMERMERIIELLEEADGKLLPSTSVDDLIARIYGHADEVRRFLARMVS